MLLNNVIQNIVFFFTLQFNIFIYIGFILEAQIFSKLEKLKVTLFTNIHSNTNYSNSMKNKCDALTKMSISIF